MINEELSSKQIKFYFATLDFIGLLFIENRVILDCNDYIVELLKTTKEDLIGWDFKQHVAEKYQNTFLNTISSKEHSSIELYLIDNQNNEIPVKIRPRTLYHGGKTTHVIFIENLTKKYKQQKEWDDIQTRFNSIMSRSEIDYLTLSTSGIIQQVFSTKNENSVFHDSETIFDIAQDQYHTRIRRVLSYIKSTPQETNLEFLDRNNQYHFCTLIPIMTENTISEIMVNDVNFTELVKSEIQITTSEMRIRNMFDLAPFAIIVIQSNMIKFINKRVLEQFEYEDEEEVYNLKVGDLLADEEVERVTTIETNRILRNDTDPDSYETIARKKDGSHFPVRLLSTTISYFDNRAVMIFVEDLSQIKHAEEERSHLKIQLERAQKLESLGILAGGIAHDFNNLLHAILGNVTLATLEIKKDKKVLDHLSEIEKITRTAGELAQQMLAYSGRGKFYIEVFDLNNFLQDMRELLQISIKKGIILNIFASSLTPLNIEADKTQIQQVILNLVTNASDASKKDQKISVSTGVEKIKDLTNTSNYYGLKPEEVNINSEYVYVKVTDEGQGIEKSKMDVIFDPFFTTKFTGRGLGLAVVLGVVRAHKGLIRVDSSLGNGSTFTLYLPHTEKKIEENKMSKDTNDKKSGSILLCDDDDAVRKVTKLMLQRIGYEVIDVSSGEDALKAYAENQSFDYVLADLTMPGMDGVELCEALKKVDSEVRVVLSSGYSQSELSNKYSTHGFMAFLQKPYSIKHLQEIFRSD